jgi:hypothetical protein
MPLLLPNTTIPAPALGPADHLALIRGGEHHAVVHCGPQPQALHHLLLAAADVLTPELLDRQRLRELDQSRGRFDVFVLAATGR